jgi:hypothetical protein
MFAVESTVAALRIALRINRAFYQLEDSPVEGGGDFNTLADSKNHHAREGEDPCHI